MTLNYFGLVLLLNIFTKYKIWKKKSEHKIFTWTMATLSFWFLSIQNKLPGRT